MNVLVLCALKNAKKGYDEDYQGYHSNRYAQINWLAEL